MQVVCSRAVILALVIGLPLFTADVPSPFSGRWDLTIITSEGAPHPAWMEFADEGGTPANAKGLTAWQRYAQVLLWTNELMFVD